MNAKAPLLVFQNLFQAIFQLQICMHDNTMSTQCGNGIVISEWLPGCAATAWFKESENQTDTDMRWPPG